ncbi:GNAT family N-acetyltransferase [Roseovarius sp. E0-M6]|uniref:GNAT family N-acetyltransferase n=1 Tax=Roseovarius sp. E0-M6 TaxID=3127118 RepID=UPI00300FCB0C
MTLLIRSGLERDAPIAVDVLRRSISELCREDHQDDPAEIASWLENKTEENWCLWVNHPDASVFVAEEYTILCGVGMARSDGEILLNYVAPETRFKGVSKALLSALEAESSARGTTLATLESTRTARRFYLANGYVSEPAGDPMKMKKVLKANG